MKSTKITLVLAISMFAITGLAADQPPVSPSQGETALSDLRFNPFFVARPEYTRPSVQKDYEVPFENTPRR